MNPILQFQSVHHEATPEFERGIFDAGFALNTGELLLLRVGSGANRPPLADLACGILAPTQGAVTYMDQDWQGLSPARAAGLRAQIGRVFDTGAWLSNLDVDESITLAQRYHTRRPEADILDEARSLAGRIGLDGLPPGRPHAVGRDTLQRAQWVRALLGHPRLLLLENPVRDVDAGGLELLIAEIAEARRRGCSVIWISSAAAELTHSALNPTLKFELKGTKMLPA